MEASEGSCPCHYKRATALARQRHMAGVINHICSRNRIFCWGRTDDKTRRPISISLFSIPRSCWMLFLFAYTNVRNMGDPWWTRYLTGKALRPSPRRQFTRSDYGGFIVVKIYSFRNIISECILERLKCSHWGTQQHGSYTLSVKSVLSTFTWLVALWTIFFHQFYSL